VVVTNSAKYPSVAYVARRLLAVQATSVPTECLFSNAGNVVTKKKLSVFVEGGTPSYF